MGSEPTCVCFAAKEQDALVNPCQRKAIPWLRLEVENQL